MQEYVEAKERLKKDNEKKVRRPWQEVQEDLRTVVLQLAETAHLHLETPVVQPVEDKPKE